MKKKNKGFTLVELIVVIAVLALLVGLLAPQYTRYVERSKKAADVKNMDEILRALEVIVIDNKSQDAESLKNGTYKVTLKVNEPLKVTYSKNGVSRNQSETIAQDAVVLLNEKLPNVNQIRLKSKNWSSDSIANGYEASLTIDISGKTTIVDLQGHQFLAENHYK